MHEDLRISGNLKIWEFQETWGFDSQESLNFTMKIMGIFV